MLIEFYFYNDYFFLENRMLSYTFNAACNKTTRPSTMYEIYTLLIKTFKNTYLTILTLNGNKSFN